MEKCFGRATSLVYGELGPMRKHSSESQKKKDMAQASEQDFCGDWSCMSSKKRNNRESKWKRTAGKGSEM
jgi:hypothetical protein